MEFVGKTIGPGNGSDNLVAGSEFSGILNGDDSSGRNEGNIVGGTSESVETLGNVNGLGSYEILNLNENEVVFGNNNSNEFFVKDGIDLNARVNLNEDINLNDVCDLTINGEGSSKRRGCIDLNLAMNDEGGVNLDVDSGVETLQWECKFDLNVGVCEQLKEAQGCADGNGHFEVDGETGQLREEVSNVKLRSMEGEGVIGNLNSVGS